MGPKEATPCLDHLSHQPQSRSLVLIPLCTWHGPGWPCPCSPVLRGAAGDALPRHSTALGAGTEQRLLLHRGSCIRSGILIDAI